MFFSCLSALTCYSRDHMNIHPVSPPQLLNKIIQNTLQLTIVITIKGALKINFVFPKKIHFSSINTTS